LERPYLRPGKTTEGKIVFGLWLLDNVREMVFFPTSGVQTLGIVFLKDPKISTSLKFVNLAMTKLI